MSISTELLALETDGGLIIADQVVEWARSNPTSELYAQFEWRDEEAAHQYRVWQARRLIAIHIVSDDGNRTRISLVRDRTAGGGYRDVERVMRNAEMREAALTEALAELERWQARYQHLVELAEIFTAARAVRARRPRRLAAERPAASA